MKIKKDHRNRMIAGSALAMAFIATAALAVPRLNAPKPAEFTSTTPVVTRMVTDVFGSRPAGVSAVTTTKQGFLATTASGAGSSAMIDAATGATRRLNFEAGSLATDTTRSRIYAAGPTQLLIVDADTGSVVGGIPGHFLAVAVDPVEGDIYALKVDRLPRVRVVRVSASPPTIVEESDSLVVNAGAVMAASHGKVYVASQIPNRLVEFDGSTLKVAQQFPIHRGVVAIAVSAESGDVAYVASLNDRRAVTDADDDVTARGGSAIHILRGRDLLKSLPTGGSAASGVAFDESGRRVFSVEGRSLVVADLERDIIRSVRLFDGRTEMAIIVTDARNGRLGVLLPHRSGGTLAIIGFE